MSDRGILFIFSLLMIIAGLGASGWLVVSGQAATVDGLFLLLTCLLVAAAFLLYLVFMIGRAMEAPKPAPAAKAPAAAKTPVAAQPTS
jgi:heme A synthase